ncbi:MAG TPA: hypothetical protein VE820_04255 [Sphingomicrobium sp.]|nr:hypothetical protein [Sphingomicrobium sp.]
MVANSRQKSLAYLMIAMAIGQVLLAIAFSWLACASAPEHWENYRARVEMPLWFAILPTATALGVSVHLWFFRHVDGKCPWANLGWLVLAVNIVALMLFIQMTR